MSQQPCEEKVDNLITDEDPQELHQEQDVDGGINKEINNHVENARETMRLKRIAESIEAGLVEDEKDNKKQKTSNSGDEENKDGAKEVEQNIDEDDMEQGEVGGLREKPLNIDNGLIGENMFIVTFVKHVDHFQSTETTPVVCESGVYKCERQALVAIYYHQACCVAREVSMAGFDSDVFDYPQQPCILSKLGKQMIYRGKNIGNINLENQSQIMGDRLVQSWFVIDVVEGIQSNKINVANLDNVFNKISCGKYVNKKYTIHMTHTHVNRLPRMENIYASQ